MNQKLLRETILFILLSFTLTHAYSQGNREQIRGVVMGESETSTRESLAGVLVSIRGTNNAVITDSEGAFILNVKEDDVVLEFSMLGYTQVRMQAKKGSTIEILMKEASHALDEIVKIGYATQRRVNLSGAVDQVSSKMLESKPMVNLAQGLQGVIPNLNIQFESGQPGTNASINIRGLTSINGGDPLILIDGIPSTSADLGRLAPTDVESVSVLKDASSSAIYGARAAFGVMLITTKTGKNNNGNKIRIDYTANFDWKKATVLPKKISDPYIYARLLQTALENTPWSWVEYDSYRLEWARERSDDPSVESVRPAHLDQSLYEYMGNRDWTRYYLDRFTYSNNHQIGLTGGTAKANYYLSANTSTENGAIKFANDSFKRQGLRSNINYNPYDFLSVGNATNYVTTIRNTPSYLSIGSLYNVFPTDVDVNPNGTWANTDLGRILAKMSDGGRTTDRNDQIITTFTAKLNVIKDILTVTGDYTFRRNNNDYRWSYRKYKIGYGPEDTREEGTNESYRSFTSTTYQGMNIYANFDKTWGKHAVMAIIGYNQESQIYDGFEGRIDKLISADLPSLNLATGTAEVADWYSDWAIRGTFGRLNYMFNNKYIIEFNGRYDGSSRFPKEKRFGFFPSTSLAWRVDREGFMTWSKDWLTMLKLRGSYGSLGNQQVSDYGYISTMEHFKATPIIGSDRPLAIGAPSIVSSNYTWETVTTINGGVDASLFNNRLNASFDIYRRNTKGMLLPGKELPGILGVSAPRENAADLKTLGWELSVAYTNSFNVAGKPLHINARVVLSDACSFITRFDNPTKRLTQYYEGQKYGEIWGLVSDGFFRSEEEIDALDERDIIPWDALAIVNGWPKYKDLDKNKRIEIGTTADDPKDIKVIGNTTPRYRYGINLGTSWRGIDFDVFMQGVGKRDYYPIYYLYWGFYQQPYAGGYEHLLDFYRDVDDIDISKHSQSYLDAGLHKANHDARYPVLQAWLADQNLGTAINSAKGLAIPQTGYMLNGAYLRIKNITLGYTLDQEFTRKFGVDRLRFYISGENIFEFSQIKKYFDPEAINNSINGYTYPFQRRYTVGLNLSF